MRILLVGSPKAVMGFDRLARLPNLGLNSIAAQIDKKHEVKVLDLVIAGKKYEKFYFDYIQKFKPDVIGFSSMVFQYHQTLEIIRKTKLFEPGIKVVLGGYHATSAYDEILNSEDASFIDFIVKGEGEITFNKLIYALDNQIGYKEIPGLAFKVKDKIYINENSTLAELDELEIPDRTSRVLKNGFHILGYRADAVETTRGCVYNCNFCSIREMYGKSFRKYKIDRVIKDIKNATAEGAEFIFFVDDNITLDCRRFAKLCNRIIEEKLDKIKYAIQASVTGINTYPGIISQMSKAGIDIIFLGIENLFEDNLKSMNKNQNYDAKTVEEIVKELKGNGITVIGGFILGYPEDNLDSIYANYEFAKKLKLDLLLLNTLTPHLKTEIRTELLEMDMVTNKSDYSKYNHHFVNVRTKYISDKELFEIKNKLDFRFPLDSKAGFNLIKKYPGFFIKIIPKRLFVEPQNFRKFMSQVRV